MEAIQWKYYGVGHRDHVFCNPVSAERMDHWISLLELPAGAAVTDIACGKAELLCRIVEQAPDVTGTGVDLSPWEAPVAVGLVSSRGLAERITIVHADGADHTERENSQALSSCIGASWIWKGYRPTLESLAAWTAPGGLVASGEPYWLKDPADEYLEFAGFGRDAWGTHEENVQTGVDLGLRPVYVSTSTLAEWDHYEWMQQRAFDRHVRDQPDDPDNAELLKRAERARIEYLRWGRDHVGFGLYLFRKP